MSHNKNTVHCVLDSGATASLISLRKVQALKLKIWPTIHTAVQVDGISGLKVLGEVHTEFSRGNLTLHFSALVVNKLGTDVLGGTNFLKENDIYSRMAKDTIVIKGNNIFQSTPVQILQMDESSSKPQLIKVKRSQTVLSGDSITCDIPPHLPPNGIFFVEPKQSRLVFHPTVVQANDHQITIENNSPDIVKVKKNEQVAQVRLSTLNPAPETEFKPEEKPSIHRSLPNLCPQPRSPATSQSSSISSEVNFYDLNKAEKTPFLSTLSRVQTNFKNSAEYRISAEFRFRLNRNRTQFSKVRFRFNRNRN